MTSNSRHTSIVRQFIASAILASLAFSILAYYEIFQLTTTSPIQPNRYNLPLSVFERSPRQGYQIGPIDEAHFIIQRAFDETYGRMSDCEADQIEKDCIKHVIEQFNKQKSDNNQRQLEGGETDTTNENLLQPLPWWFQTLLRDIPNNGAYGYWHHFSTAATNPPIRFCAMGKNGSTEWRKVFKALNAPEFGSEQKSKFNTKKELSEDTPKTVLLRDPLERLLSAYLDKCVKENIRKTQGHCEPNAIFATDWIAQRALKTGEISQPTLVEASQDSDKEMFAAYVDLFPLKWNVHFVPQAISCDLYRNIDDYDTYFMNKSFMLELDRMATNYGDLLGKALDDRFHYKSRLLDLANSTEGNVGADNSHGTKAPAKVSKYYSPRAVRRALEYLSIDYVTLKLEVPEWAREMLMNDNALH